MVINLISGPRNISTALMYSFAQRSDTSVVDEPFYAHYLLHSGAEHPGREEVIANQENDWRKVAARLFEPKSKPVYFVKNMAHHHTGMELDWLLGCTNLFLIRHPRQIIASFNQVVANPTLRDIGIGRQWELYTYLRENGQSPVVVDSNDVLKNPALMLAALCQSLGLPFETSMLSWPSGPRAEDGIWAKYWYANVHRSTGFEKQESGQRAFPQKLEGLCEEALVLYDFLYGQVLLA